MIRKTHRSKSYKRRHSRKQTHRYTRKRGGTCGACSMRGQFGGRGGMGGADLGHAFTTGASQELYQMTGRTPGLSSGGGKGNRNLATRRAAKAAKLAAQTARVESLIAIPYHLASNSLSANASAYIPSNNLRNKREQSEKNSREFNKLMLEINEKRRRNLNRSLSARAPNFIPSKYFLTKTHE